MVGWLIKFNILAKTQTLSHDLFNWKPQIKKSHSQVKREARTRA